MHTAHRKTTYRRHKLHWESTATTGLYTARSLCGKTLPTTCFAYSIPEITCKTCRRRFGYWARREEQ